MMSEERGQLEVWRSTMMSGLRNPDAGVSTRSLLELVYDDPDRRSVESVIVACLAPTSDPQLRALAVTCIGHVARIHRAVSPDLVSRAEGLLGDPELGGRAEDALDDIASFTGGPQGPG
ncbi:hypothetical protein ACFV1U_21350 [Streptomyces microflavus]|uniref:hypothetical protein n=1 Tax=Streptomyces microflavus TaxID=1919 RepID=UPI000517A89B